MTATPPHFQLRQCCDDGPASSSAQFIEPVGQQGVGIGQVVAEASVQDEMPIPSVAYHEAAHAVVAFALGLHVGEIVAMSGGHAAVTSGADSDWPRLLMLVAGDFGGGIPDRWQHRPTDSELIPWLAAVRECRMGFCDRCRIIRALIARTGHGPDRVVLDQYRRLETDVLDILDHPQIRAAIHALAGELIQAGRLSAARANEILKQKLETENA